MTENITLEEDSSSNPLATVQDIQSCLLRPASILFPPKPSIDFKQFKLNSKKKLEDYLDPVLLAAISSKIGRSKKPKTETKFKGFEWPVDELKMFVEEDSMNSNKAIDLNGDGDEEIGGSPFGRLEKTALKKLGN